VLLQVPSGDCPACSVIAKRSLLLVQAEGIASVGKTTGHAQYDPFRVRPLALDASLCKVPYQILLVAIMVLEVLRKRKMLPLSLKPLWINFL
jgi:hypothetical protein